MKLTVTREEKKKGLVFKKELYYLYYNVELTDAEKSFVKKHGWEERALIKYRSYGRDMVDKLSSVLRPDNERSFDAIEDRIAYEDDLIDEMKKLKIALETVENQAPGSFEVDLG